MTPKELRISIIRSAFAGSLTTRTELESDIHLESINEWATEYVKKPRPLDSNDVPTDAPADWKWVSFSKIVTLEKGKSVSDESLPYLEARYLRGKASKTVLNSGEVVPPGTKAILVDGENSGEVFLIPERGYLGSTFKVLNINPNVEEAFVIWFLKLHQDDYRNNKKGAAIPHLNKDIFYSMPFPLPSREEQKKIVGKIESLMPLVDEYECLWNELESLNRCFPSDLEKSILQLAFEGKLVKQLREEGDAATLYETILKTKCTSKQNSNPPSIESEEVPFEIPQSWKWVRWGDLAESIQYGYNAPAKTKGRIKMVRISDIHDDSVDWPNVPWCDIPESDIASYSLKKNDILFARTGGTVGKAFLVRDDPEPSVYAGYLIRTRYNSELINPEFLRYFMDSSLYWRQLRDGTIATAQPNCNGKTLSKMMLPLPPIGEQRRIVAALNDMFSVLRGLRFTNERKK